MEIIRSERITTTFICPLHNIQVHMDLDVNDFWRNHDGDCVIDVVCPACDNIHSIFIGYTNE